MLVDCLYLSPQVRHVTGGYSSLRIRSLSFVVSSSVLAFQRLHSRATSSGYRRTGSGTRLGRAWVNSGSAGGIVSITTVRVDQARPVGAMSESTAGE